MEYVGVAIDIVENIKQIIQGKEEQIENIVIALLTGGHVLIEDVPGVGKTTLSKALANSIACEYSRIQFTPDTLPSDVTGFSIYNMQTGTFDFCKGAVMSSIVLVDEINRTSPKTQSSLLEAMEERQVTVDGKSYALPKPFLVMATQNPVECVGTYPLPEAQLDRFLMKIRLGYPTKQSELQMAINELNHITVERLNAVADGKMICRMQQEVEQVKITEEMLTYIVEIVSRTRMHEAIALGLSPRATIAIMRVAQAKAYIRGRNYVLPDDVIDMLEVVTSHRITLTVEAKMKLLTPEKIMKQIIEAVPIPAL